MAEDKNRSIDELARAEQRAGAKLADGTFRWVLLGCAAVYLVALFLPFAGGASGWNVLAATDAARSAETKITEYAFTWVSFLGLGVVTTIAMLTRRYRVAVVGWLLTGVAMVLSVLAIWLRRSSTTWEAGLHHGPGIYLAILCVIVAVFAYIPAITRRAAEQADIARERMALQGTDEVALAQRAAAERAHAAEQNPLLIDDRRARAAQRHQRER